MYPFRPWSFGGCIMLKFPTMKGVNFADKNGVMKKPDSMTGEQCYDLPCKHTTNDGFNAIESVFELTDAEIDLIIKSKRIRLGIIGRGMPPVYMHVEPIYVCAVTTDWKIAFGVGSLENVINPEDARFIGTIDECEAFRAEHQPTPGEKPL